MKVYNGPKGTTRYDSTVELIKSLLPNNKKILIQAFSQIEQNLFCLVVKFQNHLINGLTFEEFPNLDWPHVLNKLLNDINLYLKLADCEKVIKNILESEEEL